LNSMNRRSRHQETYTIEFGRLRALSFSPIGTEISPSPAPPFTPTLRLETLIVITFPLKRCLAHDCLSAPQWDFWLHARP
jgi:hypothetical protein